MDSTKYKYTKDGKKVVVIGKLNNEQWIVQEIFVSNGQEFPAGENFVETTLLDEPAETYQAKRTKEMEERAEKLKGQIDLLEKETSIKSRKRTVARIINYATEKYENIEPEQLDTLLAFMSGEITHILKEKYGDFEIVSLVDGVEALNNHGSWESLDGLRLVSLFGCREYGERYDKDRSLRLDWKINEYRDSSGCWRKIWPCRSHKEAVSRLDKIIYEMDATKKLIELKEKYGLTNPTKKKIKEFYNRRIKSENIAVADAKTLLRKREQSLLKVKQELLESKE